MEYESWLDWPNIKLLPSYGPDCIRFMHPHLASMVLMTRDLGYNIEYDALIRQSALDCLKRHSPLGEVLYDR